MNAVIADLKSWYAQPFRADMPAHQWFALVGFIMLCFIMWGFIVSHVLKGLPAGEST